MKEIAPLYLCPLYLYDMQVFDVLDILEDTYNLILTDVEYFKNCRVYYFKSTNPAIMIFHVLVQNDWSKYKIKMEIITTYQLAARFRLRRG